MSIYFLVLFYDLLSLLMKLSWPKTLVKKWFNLQSKDGDFHADKIIYGGTFVSVKNCYFVQYGGIESLISLIVKSDHPFLLLEDYFLFQC